jgi:hypothetical protein
MRDAFVFYPHQRLGLAFHFTAILILAAATGAGIWFAATANMGLAFLLSLLPAALAVGIGPILVYRAYSLRNASYTLERDGIRLRWGWRAVDIPMNAVLWVHSTSELTYPVSLPRLRWPGSIRGAGYLPRAAEVEFMASEASKLVLIATAERTYAISPSNPQAFIETFERFTEIGSLHPIEARSVYPSLLLSRVWSSRPARLLLLSGAGLSLLLLIWVYLSTGALDQAPMGFLPDGSPGEPGPAVRLLLLPVLNGLFFLGDAVLGLFFFRTEERQPLAFLVWGTGSFTALLFLLAVFFILRVA